MERAQRIVALLVALVCLPPGLLAQPQSPPPSDAVMEEFLLKGQVVRTRQTAKGVTGSIRATLVLGDLTHDAHIQTIDEEKREFRTPTSVEFNFRDKWHFNLAAYKLDRLLDLQLVPVTVERRWRTKAGSFTWWVDDVMMDEGERLKKKLAPPDPDCWNEQMRLLRVFDQLVENNDRNLGNMLISKTWRLWAIDHTRAFRRSKVPPRPANMTQVDRRFLQRLAALDFDTLKREVGRYISDFDIRALLARRDAILAHFAAGGESMLFDRRPIAAGCLAASAHP
ncbi:hypothetical protein BH24ACI5_BH24ACI5_11600 [soil metagenome]